MGFNPVIVFDPGYRNSKTMKRVIIALMYGVLVASCSVSQNWRGTSLEQKSEADFALFSGKQKFKLYAHPDSNFTKVSYAINLKSGELRLIVKAFKKEIINVSTSDFLEKSFEIKNLAGSGLDVSLIGKKASGSYRIELEY